MDQDIIRVNTKWLKKGAKTIWQVMMGATLFVTVLASLLYAAKSDTVLIAIVLIPASFALLNLEVSKYANNERIRYKLVNAAKCFYAGTIFYVVGIFLTLSMKGLQTPATVLSNTEIPTLILDSIIGKIPAMDLILVVLGLFGVLTVIISSVLITTGLLDSYESAIWFNSKISGDD